MLSFVFLTFGAATKQGTQCRTSQSKNAKEEKDFISRSINLAWLFIFWVPAGTSGASTCGLPRPVCKRSQGSCSDHLAG
jgi:hypothetical protein